MPRKASIKWQNEGSWNEQKERLKQKFSDLTDQDLEFEPGMMDKMFQRLMVKLGKSKEDMHRFIDYLSKII